MVDDEKEPIHIRCWMHEEKCENIKETKKELTRVWEAIDKFIKAKTLMWLMGLTSVAFLTLFGYSVQMNRNAIDGSVFRDEKQQKAIDHVADIQTSVLIKIRGIEGTLHEVQSDVEELKNQ